MQMEQSNPSTIAAYAHAFASALESRGVDSQAVFDEAGIPMHATSDPFKRLTTEEVSRLFRASIKATGDPCFGIAVGECMQPGNMHALGFALLASTTLRDFFERVRNYYKVVSQVAEFDYSDLKGVSVLVAAKIDPSVCYETQDAWLAIMLRFIRFVYQQDINPCWVELVRPMPETGDQAYINYFKCPVRFDCDQLRLAMDGSVMDTPLRGASSDLAQHNDQIVMGSLGKMDRKNIINQVRKLIISDLASGILSKQAIAEKLNMSPRNLQLKLARKNTSFQDILDNIRQRLAAGYLEQSDLSITEITFMLGYADASNFTRAFRRWHGVSPKEYRSDRHISAG
jgi:AraC-like DNA-binding protein